MSNDFYRHLAISLYMLLSLLCLAVIAGSVMRMHKEQQEITHYLKLLYNDYEMYD